MENLTANEIIKRLEADWPRWQFWVVPVYIGPDTWCARRWDEADAVPARVINANSPDALVEALEDAASQPREEIIIEHPPGWVR
jgi:hypothetical protein